ncbi:MAG: hypothetical protein R2845_12125 [Thermomicrobiales bacterium]
MRQRSGSAFERRELAAQFDDHARGKRFTTDAGNGTEQPNILPSRAVCNASAEKVDRIAHPIRGPMPSDSSHEFEERHFFFSHETVERELVVSHDQLRVQHDRIALIARFGEGSWWTFASR